MSIIFCDCNENCDIDHGKVRKVEAEQRLAPVLRIRRIWRQLWRRFSSVPEKVLELLPTLHENQVVDISTECLGGILPAHKGFRESDTFAEQQIWSSALNVAIHADPSPAVSCPVPIPIPLQPNQKNVVQDGSAATADVAHSSSPESVNRMHTSSRRSDDFLQKLRQGYSDSPTLTREGTVSPSRAAAKLRQKKVESQCPTKSSASMNLESGDAQALRLGSLFGSQMMRRAHDRLYELELSEFHQEAPPTGSVLGTSHTTASFRTVVRHHRTAAATSSVSDASANTLAATYKRPVGRPAANLHSSVQAGREEHKPRSAPTSRLNTRPSAADISTMKHKAFLPSETALLHLAHSADAVSAVVDEKLRLHIDQKTTGVQSKRSDDTSKHGVRGISRQTRKPLHIPVEFSQQDTSLQEVVVEIDARDVKAPVTPQPKSGGDSSSWPSSVLVSDTKFQDVSADWGAPPPFDEEDEKLAKLYKARRRDQAAARAAQARDKGQQSSAVNSLSAGSSTPLRGNSLEFKPAPASPRLCISAPNVVVQEETKPASRGGVRKASRRNERTNLAQV